MSNSIGFPHFLLDLFLHQCSQELIWKEGVNQVSEPHEGSYISHYCQVPLFCTIQTAPWETPTTAFQFLFYPSRTSEDSLFLSPAYEMQTKWLLLATAAKLSFWNAVSSYQETEDVDKWTRCVGGLKHQWGALHVGKCLCKSLSSQEVKGHLTWPQSWFRTRGMNRTLKTQVQAFI